MQHRLAVIADEIDLPAIDAVGAEEAIDRLGVELGQLALHLAEGAGPRGALAQLLGLAQGPAQLHLDVRRVGEARHRPALQLAVAVGIQQRHVDAVHRGPAHQPQRAPQLAHQHLPVHVPGRRGEPADSDSEAMTNLKSDFLRILTERGFVHQCSDAPALDDLAAKGELIAYVGYDCTAPSLHVGSLISIMMLHWLQQTGGKPIVLMGGGTTQVGDPSGKDETRRILTLEDIERNKTGMQQAFAKFLSFGEGRTDAAMVDNAEWLARLNYIAFLRDVGRHFSVNRMLTMDSAKMRLEREQELSFIEFNYMLLQAYDFVELARRHGCRLQMGGSDQWGNIVTGIDLGRRMGIEQQLYALTCPLLTTASGAKMGKTAAGAVWLNEEQLSVYDYWQFWRNTEDADVARFLKLYTTLPLAEIAKLAALQGAEINEAKKTLATQATALLHGRDKAEAAAETARQTFEQGASAEGLPTVELPRADLDGGLGVLVAFVQAGLVKSNGEARRQIQGGGLRINDRPVVDDKMQLTAADIDADGAIKLSLGRRSTCSSSRCRAPLLSSRHLLPGSSAHLGTEIAGRWIPGTSPGIDSNRSAYRFLIGEVVSEDHPSTVSDPRTVPGGWAASVLSAGELDARAAPSPVSALSAPSSPRFCTLDRTASSGRCRGRCRVPAWRAD